MHRPAEEQLAAALALAFIPLGYLMLLLATGLHRDAQVSNLILPLLFTALDAMLCRALSVRTGWALLCAVGCFGACAMTALVMSALVGFSISFL